MLMLLIAGIACLALCGFQLTRTRAVADRDRRLALTSVRTAVGAMAVVPDAPRRSLFATKAAPVLADVHRKLWRKQDDDEIATALARAGASRRLTAELFMAGSGSCSEPRASSFRASS